MYASLCHSTGDPYRYAWRASYHHYIPMDGMGDDLDWNITSLSHFRDRPKRSYSWVMDCQQKRHVDSDNRMVRSRFHTFSCKYRNLSRYGNCYISRARW